MKDIKIVLLTTGYPRHKEDFFNVYLHRLAKFLVKKGISVHVVAPHASGLEKEELIDGVHIHRFQYIYPSSFQTLAYSPGIPEKIKTIKGKIQVIPFTLAMIVKTLEVINKYDIDIINSHWGMPPGFIATISKIFHKKPVLITLYGAELFPFKKRKSLIMERILHYTLNNADKVIGISSATCDAGKGISGREDIEILPDGIDTLAFNPHISKDELKLKYNLGSDRNIIFTSGRMVERKGFKYLLESLPIVLENFPDTVLAIGGDGPEKKNLTDEATSLGINDNIIFTGFIPDEDFPKYVRSSDIFILPSIIDSRGDTEGSATILLEAMACGIPIIGTYVGGIPYAIRDGTGGYLVDEKNSKQLADKIQALLGDANLRKDMGTTARTYVEKNFSMDMIAETYVKMFIGLLDKKIK